MMENFSKKKDSKNSSDPEINLLRKTELWIEGISLQNVHLDESGQPSWMLLGWS